MKFITEIAENYKKKSRPARGAWVEMYSDSPTAPAVESRPARGAWVEIVDLRHLRGVYGVAPRKGRVG